MAKSMPLIEQYNMKACVRVEVKVGTSLIYSALNVSEWSALRSDISAAG
jgi:hypothetical protein